MSATKNIVLVDDHFVVRHGLKELIEKIGPYKISHQFEDGEEFIASIPENPKADLIILDIEMPIMSGDEVMEKLNARSIKTPVLVLTVGASEEIVIKLFKLGIRGYLMKNCGAKELKEAIESILQTGYYIGDFSSLLGTGISLIKKSEKDAILEQISEREREFLRYVCHENEYSYKQIADIMNVQFRTIDWYRESLFYKFGVKSKTGLVVFVLHNDLFDIL